MGDAGFFKGTSADQDPRFKNKEQMAISKMKFPPEFDTKVDMRKVELSVMKPWIANKLVQLLGFEDDVLIEYVYSLLEDPENQIIDAKKMQHALTGFFHKQTPEFMQSLWGLLLSAQSNPLKVPSQLLEEKKAEMRQREQEAAMKRREEEMKLNRFQQIRSRERENRQQQTNLNTQRGGDPRGGPSREMRADYGAQDRGGYPGDRNQGRGGRFEGPGGNRGGGFNDRAPRGSNYDRLDQRDFRDRDRRDQTWNQPRPVERRRERSFSRSRSRSPPRGTRGRGRSPSYSRSRSRSRSYSRSPRRAPARRSARSRSRSRSFSRSRSKSRSPAGRRRRRARSPSYSSDEEDSRRRSNARGGKGKASERRGRSRTRSLSRSRSTSPETSNRRSSKKLKREFSRSPSPARKRLPEISDKPNEKESVPQIGKSKWENDEQTEMPVNREGDLKEKLLKDKLKKTSISIKGAASK